MYDYDGDSLLNNDHDVWKCGTFSL